MTLSPGLRTVALIVHVTTSVGWLGAVVGALALAMVGVTHQHAATVRGVYLVLDPFAWFVLVPLAIASFLSGLVAALGTAWGLFRHYWVVCKLVLTAGATGVLLMYLNTFELMARVAAQPDTSLAIVRNPSPVLHGAVALLVLVVATVLSIVKPRGLTPYGWRRQHGQRA